MQIPTDLTANSSDVCNPLCEKPSTTFHVACVVSSTSDGSMATETAQATGKAPRQPYQICASTMLGLKLSYSNHQWFGMHSKRLKFGVA